MQQDRAVRADGQAVAVADRAARRCRWSTRAGRTLGAVWMDSVIASPSRWGLRGMRVGSAGGARTQNTTSASSTVKPCGRSAAGRAPRSTPHRHRRGPPGGRRLVLVVADPVLEPVGDPMLDPAVRAVGRRAAAVPPRETQVGVRGPRRPGVDVGWACCSARAGGRRGAVTRRPGPDPRRRLHRRRRPGGRRPPRGQPGLPPRDRSRPPHPLSRPAARPRRENRCRAVPGG